MGTATEQPTKEQAQVPAKVTEGFGTTAMERSSEMASKAVEASARAEVESAYIMAMRNPRSEENARIMITAVCRIPSFAARAKYRKKVGSKKVGNTWEDEFAVGPSIRFAEQMLRCWRNVLCQQTTIYNDQLTRITKLRVVDLESNVNYSKEVTLDKQVERKSAAGREVLGKRLNSTNETVFIVRATEDEIANKEAAHASKVIRNNGLRLIPQHIVDEAMKAVDETLASKIKEDPNAERIALLNEFGKVGVLPTDLEKYLGVPVPQFTVANLMQLREVLTSIEDGQSTWAEFAEAGPVTKVEAAAASMAQSSQPANQGDRLAQDMKDGEQKGSEKAPVPNNVDTAAQGDKPLSDAEKVTRIKSTVANMLTMKGGDAIVRGFKIPQSGIPADQVDFYYKQVMQGEERLKAMLKK